MFKKPVVLISLAFLLFMPAANAEETQSGGDYQIDRTLQANDNVIAKVNDKTISVGQLYARLFSINGRDVLTQMINEILLDDAAKENKISITDKDVNQRYGEVKARFVDEANFNNWAKNNNLTEEMLKKQIRTDLARENLIIKVKGIKVTDKDIKDFYDANKEKLGTPEQIRCRHILVKTKAEADEMLIALQAGADFAKMAQLKSVDATTKERGGDLGYFSRGILLPQFENVAFSLKTGEISQPVQTTLGFHIIKLEDKKPATEAKFDKTTKDNIRKYVISAKISEMLPQYLQELQQKAKIEAY